MRFFTLRDKRGRNSRHKLKISVILTFFLTVKYKGIFVASLSSVDENARNFYNSSLEIIYL